MPITTKFVQYSSLGLLVSLSAAAQDSADDQSQIIEEVIVTATLRGDSLLQTPASVAVIDAQTLADAGQQHLADVLDLVPNVNWSSASSRPRYIQIRGIGERSQYEGAPNPSIGFLVDEIDFSALGGVATTFDVEQIEVLRGPQGTRYGANALGGLIYVRSAEPSTTFEQGLEASLGDDDLRSLGYVVSGPLSDQSAGRLAVQSHRSNGFRDNVFLDRDDTNGRDELTARGKLRWTPNDDWQLDFTGLLIDIDNGFDAFATDNGLTVYSDQPGRDQQDSAGLALRAEYIGWAQADLVSITTIGRSDIVYSFDGDWGNPDFWGSFAPEDFTSETLRERDTVSQELRLVSNPEYALFGGSTDWLLGLYAAGLDETNVITDIYNGFSAGASDSDYEAHNLALFGQFDVALNDRDTVTAGLRVERRSADYLDFNDEACDFAGAVAAPPRGLCRGTQASPSETMVGGQLAWVRQLGADRSVFVNLAKGYKAGGFNLGLNPDVPNSGERLEFDTESLWNLEAGLRGTFAGGSVDAGVVAFYSRRYDMQVNTSFQIPNTPQFVFLTDNAAEGVNYGLEADASWQLNADWRLFASLGLLETEFEDFVTAERNLNGREQAHAPTYQFALGAEYRSATGWFGRVDVTGKDEFFFSDSHDQIGDGYELVNLKLGYEADRWSAYLWGRNLTDETYATRGFFFGLDPRIAYADQLYIQRGDPQQLGATVSLEF